MAFFAAAKVRLKTRSATDSCSSKQGIIFTPMIQAVVVGTGNLGSHLCKALEGLSPVRQSSDPQSPNAIQPSSDSDKHVVNLLGYLNHSNRELDCLNAPLFKDRSKLAEADVIFLCVPDDKIRAVSKSMPKCKALIVHCSGAAPMSELDLHSHRGVFYILQTFREAVEFRFRESENEHTHVKCPGILLEAATGEDLDKLKTIARKLSDKVLETDSESRLQMHCAAVFANNFTNHSLAIADDICRRNHLDPLLLRELIRQTMQNALNLTPREVQTGPARRGDSKTIERHLNLLSTKEQAVYRAMTESIKNMYEL